jgi:hypothetical protein
MKSHRMIVALATMLLAIPATGPYTQAEGSQDGAAQQAQAAVLIAPIDVAADAEAVTSSVRQVRGVTQLKGPTLQNKYGTVVYMPGQVSVNQIAQAVADIPRASGAKPFQARLLIGLANLGDSATQEKAISAVKKVPGVASAMVYDAPSGLLAIEFAPLAAADKTGGPKGATQEQITKALMDAGLTIKADLVPAAGAPA